MTKAVNYWKNFNLRTRRLLASTLKHRSGLWMMLDELPSLYRLPHLMPTLSEGRKFGGRFVLAMQNYEQLQDIAKALLSPSDFKTNPGTFAAISTQGRCLYHLQIMQGASTS